MSATPRPELAADLEFRAVCTTAPPIAAAVVLAGVLLVELDLGDRRADVGRAAARARRGPRTPRGLHHRAADLEIRTVCTTAPPIAAAVVLAACSWSSSTSATAR